ncbi:MAG TPA: UDP-N-acetylmuramoyl-L-alanine--D-glutamate ligase [Firmicutes bacterium]|nr:UDP-N-acetylmuramoyl-L-alanine--D-glutamate ligase [Bacillales bacterium]HJA41323.1 UDP-N-acetylmuramoyl-L-alanine--D-glutamate ligase [Bacillota bacterium]
MFQNQTILVLGIAKSGNAVSRLLKKLGAHVVVNDKNKVEPASYGEQLRILGCEVYDGGHPIELFDKYHFSLVVKNPGIPYQNIMVQTALKRGISVVTEVEIAYLINPAPMIGITGSNGKTTTTTLIFQMLAESAKHPLIAGNIGEVASEVVQNATKENVVVTELSSFQLMGTKKFRPHIAVVLNIFDAHLDYHGTKAEYIRAKMKIFANQTKTDFAVINIDDEYLAAERKNLSGTVIPFSVHTVDLAGAYIQNEAIYFQQEKIIDIKDILLPGVHNLENILAAVCAVKAYGGTTEAIVHILKTFQGVTHRLQFIKEWNGRKFYNDSKATNILATQKAIASFSNRLVLIAGGLDRGNSFDALIPSLKNVAVLIAYGETKEKLCESAQQARVSEIITVSDLPAAFHKAVTVSKAGDTILLSPACASWDQFKTFEERGGMFVQLVNTLV